MDQLHIFYVNKCDAIVLDGVVPSVEFSSIKNSIRRLYGVPIDEQVLLCSGGSSIDEDKRVGDFAGHGTPDNPIFFFRRNMLRNDGKPEVESSQEIEEVRRMMDNAVEMAKILENSTDLTQIYVTLPDRARQCRDAALRCLESLAQITQNHQKLASGWMALNCNMEDSINLLRKRTAKYQQNVEKMNIQREKANSLLQDFDVCLEHLKKINVPSSLFSHIGKQKPSKEVSLYEWLSSMDPQHSLQELVDQVKDQLNKLNVTNSAVLVQEVDRLREQSRSPEIRELKGINKRLSQLEFTLTKMNGCYQNIRKCVNDICQQQPHLDKTTLVYYVNEHRKLMDMIYRELTEMKEATFVYNKSKTEIVTYVTGRMRSWVVVVYDKLHQIHVETTVFEEKYNGLRQRLNLVKQIKESPIIYASAVCEVIRRASLQKEFRQWFSQHSDKCESMVKEEQKIRSSFASKLESHFLRVLFPGMFDTFPEFYLKETPAFDNKLPKLTAEYLRTLRAAVPELESCFKVTTPQIFQKLSGVRDSPHGVNQLRREESFFTPEAVDITTMNSFPSTTWLSEDQIDNSPMMPATIRMGTGQPENTNSNMPIPPAPSLNQLSMLDRTIGSGSVAKSAPINIPVQQHEKSNKSSEFSTPEEECHSPLKDSSSLQQFPLDDLTTRSQEKMERLKPMIIELATISKNLLDIRAEFVNNKDKFNEDFNKILQYSKELEANTTAKADEKYEEMIKEKDQDVKSLTEKLELAITDKIALQTEFDEFKEESEKTAQELREENEMLKKKLEEQVTKTKEVEAEIFKKLTIDYELQTERIRADCSDQLEERDRQIQHLKKDLEKKNQDIVFLKSDADSELARRHITDEIRNELQMEFKNKNELISKGLQQQKDDFLIKCKKEYEFEIKQATSKMNMTTKLLQLEKDQLCDYIEQMSPEGQSVVATIKKDIQKRVEETEGKNCYVMNVNTYVQTDNDSYGEPPNKKIAPLDDMSESSYAVMKDTVMGASVFTQSTTTELQDPANDKSCQTKIVMRGMEMMVALQDISEGSTVLVIWDERCRAYILFSSSPFKHFVKESCVRRLGLDTVPRRSWLLAKVGQLDLCLIKKAVNRYQLPVDTRVYRVEVTAIDINGRPARVTSASPTNQ